MNKEFEKQYRNYITEQMPDMWDRIEAGLKEKRVERADGREADRRKLSFTAMKKAAAVLVPAAAVFLCFFVSRVLWGSGGKSDRMMADSSNGMAFEENRFLDGAPLDAADGAEIAEDALMSADGAEDAVWNVFEEEAGDAAQKEFQAAEDAAQEGIGEAAENAAGSEEQPFLTVRLRIEKMTEPVMQGYDAMYLCTVTEVVENREEQTEAPPEEQRKEGTEIFVYVSGDTEGMRDSTLKEGEEYEAVLERISKEEYFVKKINLLP